MAGQPITNTQTDDYKYTRVNWEQLWRRRVTNRQVNALNRRTVQGWSKRPKHSTWSRGVTENLNKLNARVDANKDTACQESPEQNREWWRGNKMRRDCYRQDEEIINVLETYMIGRKRQCILPNIPSSIPLRGHTFSDTFRHIFYYFIYSGQRWLAIISDGKLQQ